MLQEEEESLKIAPEIKRLKKYFERTFTLRNGTSSSATETENLAISESMRTWKDSK